MDTNDLHEIGISDKEAQLFLKVKEVVGSHPEIEQILNGDPEEVYRLCAESGQFTVEELQILSKSFRTSLGKKIIKYIKSLFRRGK